MQKGIVQLLVPIVIIILVIGGIGVYSLVQKKPEDNLKQDNLSDVASVSATVEPSETDTDESSLDQSDADQSITKPTINPTLIPTQPASSKATCNIVSFSDANNSSALKLVYGLTANSTNAYMTGAQWDFNNDGSWDTDLSQQNGNVTHTFSNGTHTVNLQLKLSNGEMTKVCSTVVTVPQGFSVSFSGFVFADKNCNKAWDTDEGYLSGVEVVIVKLPEYSTYKELTTDSNGKFSFTTILNSGENLTINPSVRIIPNYSIVYYSPNYTLNSSSTNASGWLSMVPNENVPNCS